MLFKNIVIIKISHTILFQSLFMANGEFVINVEHVNTFLKDNLPVQHKKCLKEFYCLALSSFRVL